MTRIGRLGLFALTAISFFGIAQAAGQQAGVPLSFDDEQQFERAIAPGETHAYEISAKVGEFIRFAVDMPEIDVQVSLEDPRGEVLAREDRNSEFSAAGTISFIAPTAGKYRLLIRSEFPRAGTYEARVIERRAAVPADRDRVEGERLFREAKTQHAQQKAQSLLEAEKTYGRALVLFRKLNDTAATAEVLKSVAFLRWMRADHAKSVEAGLESLSIRQCLPEIAGRAETLNNLGLAFSGLGDKRKAIAYFEAALRNEITGDTGKRAIALSNIGTAYTDMGDLDEALAIYIDALRQLQTGEKRLLELIHTNIGGNYNRRGEWEEALRHYQQAMAFSRAVEDRSGEGILLINIGSVYDSRGEARRGLEYFERGLTIARETGARAVEAGVLNRMARTYLTIGELDRALEHQELALKLYRDVGDRMRAADALLGLGRIYAAKSEFAKSLQAYQEALPISRVTENHSGEALLLKAIGEAQLASGQIRAAIATLDQAVEMFHALHLKPGEAATLHSRAKAHRAAGDLNAARADVEAALAIIDRLRGNITTADARAWFLASVADMVELHVDLLMQLHRQQPAAGFHALALQASERARGRSLVELLREAHGGALQHADPTLLERERSLRRHISTKAQAQLRLASLRHTPTQQAMIAREIEELMSEYESVATELRRSNRGLASALQAEPIDVSRLQRNLLDDSTTLLEYALGSEKSFLWVVTKKSLHVYELPPRAEIESAGRTAYEQLSVADGSGDGVRQLSRMLLGPASRDLKGKRLVIVSDGVIQYLPFGALLVGSEPLIRRFEVTTLPSVSTLAVLRDAPRRSKPPKTLLVFADPVFDSEDPRVASGSKPATRAMTLMAESSSRSADDARETELERSQKDIGLARLARLPFTRREANALLSLVPADQGKAVLDFDANRQFVTGPEIGRYRFIHFATHGLLNSFRPELSGIVLSMVDENGNEQNGFLSTADVFNMSLHADLVVLSGCRTGLGREIKGEGIAGLTRAFIYAGAPRVVASLWKVNDAATAELMKRFYEGMLRPHRLSAAAALREAQISLSKEKRWSAPYYWAAFVLQGEWN